MIFKEFFVFFFYLNGYTMNKFLLFEFFFLKTLDKTFCYREVMNRKSDNPKIFLILTN